MKQAAALVPTDDRLRKAVQRLRGASDEAAAASCRDAVRDTVRGSVRDAGPAARVAAPSPQPRACTVAGEIQTDRQALLARARASVAPLESELKRLTSDVYLAREALTRCRESSEKVLPFSGGSAPSSDRSTLEATQASITWLCQQARYEEACEQALAWDGKRSAGDSGMPMSEWACRQVLCAGNAGMECAAMCGMPLSPETFLAKEPCPLSGDALKMGLLAALLSPVAAQNVGVERAEFVLEWATALVYAADSGPWLRAVPAQRAVESALQALGELVSGRAPCLAAAPQHWRSGAVRRARMVAKQLELTQRMSLRTSTTV